MKKYNGFTLIELMMTMALVGILLLVGLPSLKTFMQGNLLVAATNDLISAFHIARSEAIKLNTRVSICSSSDGVACSDDDDWKSGWIVFVDSDGDFSGTEAACTATGTDCLLRSHEAFSAGAISLVGEDANASAVNKVTFTSRGMPKSVSGLSQTGIFNICSLDADGKTTDSRAVVLSLSGRVRVSDNAAVITQCPES